MSDQLEEIIKRNIQIVTPPINEKESKCINKSTQDIIASFLCAILMLIYQVYMLMLIYQVYMRFTVFWNCMAGIGFIVLIHNSDIGHLVARFLFYTYCAYYMCTHVYIETC